MLSESVAGQSRQAAKGHAFWFRLTDNLFRRLGWFLLPIVVLTLVGFAQASKTQEFYQSSGTLSSSTNPGIPDQQISGVNAQLWETPASTTSRVINELLRTNNFLEGVAKDAKLDDAVKAGLLDLGVLRGNIWAAPSGDSILSVNAQWGDPQTAYNLVVATIGQYRNYLADTAASDSTEAETFWSGQLDLLQSDRDSAQAALVSHLETLPTLAEGEEYSYEEQATTDRLQTRVDSLDARIETAQNNLDEARLTQAQDSTEVDNSLRVVDQPVVPGAPVSTLMHRVTLVGSFMLLGAVIAAAALIVTTVLDQTVASTADLLGVGGIGLVATVPQVRIAGAPAGRRGINRRRARRESTGSAVP